jgi:hypothetical protein
MGAITKSIGKIRSIISEPMATLLASIIGGVCAVVAAFGPAWMENRKPPAPVVSVGTPRSSTNELTAESPTLSWRERGSAPSPIPSVPPTTMPNLTYGIWTVYASTDAAGSDFSSSILKFTAQEKTDDGLKVAGFFEWRDGSKDELLGREKIVGNYIAATRELFLEGQSVEQAPQFDMPRLAIGSYSARLSGDGRKFIDGSWGNTPGNAAGVLGGWEARR